MSDKPPSGWTPDDSATEVGPPSASPPPPLAPSRTEPNPFEEERTIIPEPPHPTRDAPVRASPEPPPERSPLADVPTRINQPAGTPAPPRDVEDKEITTSVTPPIRVEPPAPAARWPWVAGGGVGVFILMAIAWSLLSDPPGSNVEIHPPVEVMRPSSGVPAAAEPVPAEAPAPPEPAAAPPSSGADSASAEGSQPSDEMDIGGLINTARGNLLLMRLSRRDKRKVSAELENLNNKRMAAKDPRQRFRAESALRAFIKKHKLS